MGFLLGSYVYESSGKRSGASDFYYGEIRAKQKTAYNRIFKGKVVGFPQRVLSHWVLLLCRLVSGYGLNPFAAVLAFIVFLFAAAFIFQNNIELTETAISSSNLNMGDRKMVDPII